MEEKTIKRGKPVAALEALKKKRAAGEVFYTNNPLQMLKRHPSSLKRAVMAQCFVCQGGTMDKTPEKGWKQRIAFCGQNHCPMFYVRPYVASFVRHAADGDDK